MHAYRTHTCAQLTAEDVGETVRLSGWVHNKRDHGGVLFVDLRDHYGITQVVADSDSEALGVLEKLKLESVVTIDGTVKARADAAVNANLPTGAIEVFARAVTVQSRAEDLPLIVNSAEDYPEETRLKYRFVDLRRERLHKNIVLRSQVISSIRRRMIDKGFTEFQTPILGAFQPRGRARLSGAQPPPPGALLCPPAGAADVQTAADGGGLRPLFPDRAMLSRRGFAGRSLAPNSTSSTSR